MFKRRKKRIKKSASNTPSVSEEMILSAYDMFDDDDVSTGTLLCMVADYCNCDIDDVTDVLIRYRAE